MGRLLNPHNPASKAAFALFASHGLRIDMTTEIDDMYVPLLGQHQVAFRRMPPTMRMDVMGPSSIRPRLPNGPLGRPAMGPMIERYDFGDEWSYGDFTLTIRCRAEEEAEAVLERLAWTLNAAGTLADFRMPYPRNPLLLMAEVGPHKRWRGYGLPAA